MSSKDKVSRSKGYHWRDELVNRLFQYVKHVEGDIQRGFLNNLVREYVPGFFPTKIPSSNGATWLFPFSLSGLKDYWWKKEIEDIGKEFAEESGHLDDRSVRRIFKNHNWDTSNTNVEGISLLDKRGTWKYDALKREVAVEVELSSRSQVFKDSFKFLIG